MGAVRLGFFTGTFDPPHLGHDTLVRVAIERLNLDRFFVFVNTAPSHKPKASAFEDRLAMAQLHFRDLPAVTVGPRLSQTEIVPFLQKTLPNVLLFQILGSDSMERIPPDALMRDGSHVQFVVFPRGTGKVHGPPGINRLEPVSVTSSSAIREQVTSGRKPRELVKGVWEHINRQRLYGLGNLK